MPRLIAAGGRRFADSAAWIVWGVGGASVVVLALASSSASSTLRETLLIGLVAHLFLAPCWILWRFTRGFGRLARRKGERLPAVAALLAGTALLVSASGRAWLSGHSEILEISRIGAALAVVSLGFAFLCWKRVVRIYFFPA